MTIASDNIFPKIIVAEAAAPASPSAGDFKLFVDSSDHLLKMKNSAGVVTTFGTGLTDPMTTRGDVIVRNAANATARLAIGSSGKVLQSDGTDVSWQTPSGGVTPAQAVPDPTSFDGSNTINGSSTTPFVDVSAFDTKEVLNSRVLHLQTKGASKDQRVRVTLGTTKAAAFDVRTRVSFNNEFWSAGAGDTYLEIRGSTSADAQIFIARIYGILLIGTSATPFAHFDMLRVGHTSITSTDANFEPKFPLNTPVTLRVERDGSNILTFSFGFGAYPLALGRVTVKSDLTPYGPTSSGTLARVEYSIHTPSGPGSTAAWDAFVDYVTNN